MEIPWIKMLIKPHKFKTFQNLRLVHQFNILIKPKENHCFWKADKKAHDMLVEKLRNLQHF